MQGQVRASTQSNARWKLKRGFRSEFKPEKGPREKELFPGELGKQHLSAGIREYSAASQLGLRFDTTIFWACKMLIT